MTTESGIAVCFVVTVAIVIICLAWLVWQIIAAIAANKDADRE